MINALFKYGLPLVALAMLGFAVVHVAGQSAPPPTAPQRRAGEPPRNPFPHTVAGSGVVEPETENIAIGSATPGVVINVLVKVGQRVTPGQELFRLDDRALQAELRFREASLAASQAELTRLENEPRAELLDIAKAQLEESEANAISQHDQMARTRELFSRKVATAEDMVAREQAYRMAKAQLARNQSQYAMQKAGAWEYDKQVARAAVEKARAQVSQIQIELDRLVVRALVPGDVLQVNVRPGEFVGAPAGQPLIVLGNIQQLHIRVDIDEYDIPRFRSGSPARAMLKGQSDSVFPLRFVRVEPYVVPKRSLTGDNTERVDTRVLQVIYAIEGQCKQLYVGQQVDVFIDASDAAESTPDKPQEDLSKPAKAA